MNNDTIQTNDRRLVTAEVLVKRINRALARKKRSVRKSTLRTRWEKLEGHYYLVDERRGEMLKFIGGLEALVRFGRGLVASNEEVRQ